MSKNKRDNEFIDNLFDLRQDFTDILYDLNRAYQTHKDLQSDLEAVKESIIRLECDLEAKSTEIDYIVTEWYTNVS